MGCGCNNSNSSLASDGTHPELGAAPATIQQQQYLEQECNPGSTFDEPQCAPDAQESTGTQGTILDTKYTVARCANEGEGLTLLARAGNILSKFSGNGFLQIVSGKAVLVKWIPVSITQLWHKYVKPEGKISPILSDPKAFRYGVIADKNGNLYGIQGKDDRNGVHVWNYEAGMWETWNLSELPIQTQKALTQSDCIELTGFEPVPVAGDPSDVRDLKALAGKGIIYLERVPVAPEPTPEGCPPCPDNNFATVAKVLPYPLVEQTGQPSENRHRLIFSSIGFHWERELPDGSWTDQGVVLDTDP